MQYRYILQNQIRYLKILYIDIKGAHKKKIAVYLYLQLQPLDFRSKLKPKKDTS